MFPSGGPPAAMFAMPLGHGPTTGPGCRLGGALGAASLHGSGGGSPARNPSSAATPTPIVARGNCICSCRAFYSALNAPRRIPGLLRQVERMPFPGPCTLPA
jgi:hypothetical protein